MNMLNQRSIQRHQLPYYLNVFNRFTDKPLGFIGNLSETGLMLISPYPMMIDARSGASSSASSSSVSSLMPPV